MFCLMNAVVQIISGARDKSQNEVLISKATSLIIICMGERVGIGLVIEI